MSADRSRRSDLRVIRWLLTGLLVLLGAMYLAAYAYAGDRVPRNTSVNGIQIGGLRPAAAERRLAAGLADPDVDQLVLTALGERAVIRPGRLGLKVDVAATVERARLERSLDPRSMWRFVTGGRDLEPSVTDEGTALDDAIASFAARVDRRGVDGSVRFRGDAAIARYPRRGTVIDRPAAADAVRAAFLRGAARRDVVRLPTREDRPRIDAAAVSRAMKQFANPAVAEPLRLRLAGRTVVLAPEEYTSALSMTPAGAGLRPQLDGAALLRVVRPRLRPALEPARNATVRIVGGRPRVVPGRVGRTFDPGQLVKGFLPALTRTGAARTLDLRTVPRPPERDTAEARRLRITERVSQFATYFPYAEYRNVNLPRAAELMDGTILEPGETFSLNGTVGERTAANGFTEGFIIRDGVYAEDLGGGVSQVATTLFNAAFFAGMQDVEHKPHSFYIDRYPVGREATVAWPTVDLKFKNTTPYGVLVDASVEKSTPGRQGVMRVAMWSTKYWDIESETSARYAVTSPGVRRISGPDCVPNEGFSGFDIDVYRLWRRAGSERLLRRERMHTRYAAADTVICQGSPE